MCQNKAKGMYFKILLQKASKNKVLRPPQPSENEIVSGLKANPVYNASDNFCGCFGFFFFSDFLFFNPEIFLHLTHFCYFAKKEKKGCVTVKIRKTSKNHASFTSLSIHYYEISALLNS